VTIADPRPWLKPAAYISLASISCFLFTAFTPPVLSPTALSALPFFGSIPGDGGAYWLRFALSFALLGLLPLALARAFGERPADLGLRFDAPILRSRLYWTAVPLAFAAGALGALWPDVAAYYPYSRDLVGRSSAGGAWPFLAHAAAYFFLYYLPWEFFFRGFLLLGLARGLPASSPGAGTGTTTGGASGSDRASLAAALVLFQTMPSTMLHVGHPLSELFGAVVAGIGFGILAWRTRSIVPGLLIHAALGIGADALIVLRGAGAL
jgi:membrane protease YdiL (CAAX protease family)